MKILKNNFIICILFIMLICLCGCMSEEEKKAQAKAKLEEDFDKYWESLEKKWEEEENNKPSKQRIEEHAEIYLDMDGFSKEKLIEQLIYEDFKKSEVEAVVESLDVDWKEQAVIAAKKLKSFDKDYCNKAYAIDYLMTIKKFTMEEAEYAAEQVFNK